MRMLLALALAVLVAPPHAAFAQAAKPTAPPAMIAVAAIVEGPAKIQAKGTTDWIPLKVGQPIDEGDKVQTEQGGRVVVAFSDGSKVQLRDKADFQVEALAPKKMNFRLALGLLDAWIAKLKGRRFQIRSPTAVAAVRGTQLGMNVDATGNTEVFCFSGSIQVSPPSPGARAIEVPAGQTVAATKDAPVSAPAPLPPTVVAPPEPPVAAPEPGKTYTPAPAPTQEAPAPVQEPAPTETKEGSTATTEGTTEPAPTTTTETAPPPPNPLQETSTISPSSP